MPDLYGPTEGKSRNLLRIEILATKPFFKLQESPLIERLLATVEIKNEFGTPFLYSHYNVRY